MRPKKRPVALPIGRTARIAFEIDALRGACSKAAAVAVSREPMDELELEECAILDEQLARVQRLLKHTVRVVMLSRLSRRSRAKQ